MVIDRKLLTKNPYSRSGEKQGKIEYIVVHWVGNANSSAIANRNYFENLRLTRKTKASAHYVIGLKGEVIQCIPNNEVAFHAGSHSMNRKSIGIENCHPDWGGKFNDATYNSLIELCVTLCKQYGINADHVIRHYDVTGKQCPLYYVKNQTEWALFRNRIAQRLNQNITPVKEEKFEMAKTYLNGSTPEPVYADTTCKLKTGSLDKHEICECLAVVNGVYLVKYKMNGSTAYKTGFVKYNGGVK